MPGFVDGVSAQKHLNQRGEGPLRRDRPDRDSGRGPDVDSRTRRANPLAPGSGLQALLVLVLLSALGCSTVLAPPPTAPSPTTYRVGAPDKLLITILPDPVIERSVTVRPDGMFSIELAGDIRAAGYTVDEIAAEVEKKVSIYKRGATVTVSVVATESTAVTVLGEVRGNRSFPLVKETRVSEAMGIVGGTTMFGNIDEIRVIRSRAGETVVYEVDLDAITDGDMRTDIVLAAGDLVYVPPTIWAKFGYAIQAVLFPFQPLLGIGTSVAGNVVTP